MEEQLHRIQKERDDALVQLERIKEGLLQAQTGELGGELRAAFNTFQSFDGPSVEELAEDNHELGEALDTAKEEIRDLRNKLDRQQRLLEATQAEEEVMCPESGGFCCGSGMI